MCSKLMLDCTAASFSTLTLDKGSEQNPGWGPDPNFLLIRLSRPKLYLIRLSRQKLTLIRLSRRKIPLTRLSRHKGSLIRLFRPKAFWSGHLQTMVQTQIQTVSHTSIRLWSNSSALEEVMIRLKCARNSLIRETFYLWSNILFLL